MNAASDAVPIAPAISGPAGRAWRIDLDHFRTSAGAALNHTGIAGWIVEAPAAHPFWHSYWVTLVHLRPVAGMPDAILYDPRATHELLIFALDPGVARLPAIKGDTPPSRLEPVNFGAQLVDQQDEGAAAIVESAVSLIVTGELNPDTDARRQWRALFGDNMIRPEWR